MCPEGFKFRKRNRARTKSKPLDFHAVEQNGSAKLRNRTPFRHHIFKTANGKPTVGFKVTKRLILKNQIIRLQIRMKRMAARFPNRFVRFQKQPRSSGYIKTKQF